MTDPIVKTLNVPCTAEQAFDVFVERIGTWWPLESHAASAAAGKAALDVTIEPHVGGAVYETMWDGGRNDWGKVLEFERGKTLSMTWHPGNNADHPTQVTVTFEDTSAGARVVLTHSGWEIWADKAADARGNYDGGWDVVFGSCFRQALAHEN